MRVYKLLPIYLTMLNIKGNPEFFGCESILHFSEKHNISYGAALDMMYEVNTMEVYNNAQNS